VFTCDFLLGKYFPRASGRKYRIGYSCLAPKSDTDFLNKNMAPTGAQAPAGASIFWSLEWLDFPKKQAT